MNMITLSAALDRKPQASDFKMREIAVPDCLDSGVLVRVVYLSLDPYVGSRLRGQHMSGPAPIPLKEAIPGAILGQVITSRSELFREGDWIYSMEGSWADYVSLPAQDCRKIDPKIAPLKAHMSILGMPGLTAWAGVTQLAKIRQGDVFLVDAAAGTVGGVAGQIARINGASRIVGIAGGPQKCEIVEDTYGFDACIDYEKDNWQEALGAALPEGLSVFFENVSAEMAMISLSHAQTYARGVLCGLAAGYHSKTQIGHPLNARAIIGKRAQIFGLVVYDYYPQWEDYIAQASQWIDDGKITIAEDCADGLAQAPTLFEKLLNGHNIGKSIIRVAEE